jgi:Putative Flp pilus-assembly TadE/G-like
LRRRIRSESGQVTVMIVGFFLVVGVLTAVVIDASAAYLRNQSLNSLADGAALAAVDGIEGEQVYSGDLDERADLDPTLAERYVEQYLFDVGARDDYPGLSWSVRLHDERAVVELSAPMRLPITPPGWDDSTVITGEASAVVPIT